MARYVTIRRDPIARADLARHCFARGITPDRCRWCGEPRAKFIYFWIADDGHHADAEIRHAYQQNLTFCSVGCWRAFQS